MIVMSIEISQETEARLAAEARRRGFTAAERLLGKCEIHLGNSPAQCHAFAAADEAVEAGAQLGRAEGVRHRHADDAEDQFAF